MNFVYRWLAPILVFAIAGYVWNFNNTHIDSALYIPFLDWIPPLKGDLVAQADASWKGLIGLGVIVSLSALWDQFRSRPKPEEEEPEA